MKMMRRIAKFRIENEIRESKYSDKKDRRKYVNVRERRGNTLKKMLMNEKCKERKKRRERKMKECKIAIFLKRN